MKNKIIVLCGPTASGKSSLALRLASEIDAEIVNADSQQIYRGLDIGTAKPLPVDRKLIPHHLVDILNPDQIFSAADFVHAADAAIADILARGKKVLVVGGTGLYIRALLHGLVDSPGGAGDIREKLHEEVAENGADSLFDELRQVDPESADSIHPNNLVRVIRALEVYRLTGIPLSRYQQQHGFAGSRYRSLQIGLHTERSLLYKRIDSRVEQMLSDGLEHEVRQLLDNGVPPDAKGLGAIGYKETVAWLAGDIDREEAVRLIKRNTRHYAKRQLTWFQADQSIVWFDYPEKYASIFKHVLDFFEEKER